MKRVGLVLCMPMLLASLALAAGPSMEKGKELFNNTALGTNGKSCATCHRDGKRLEGAAAIDDGELAGTVNQCIERTLAGKSLDPASDNMKSLIMYIRSFANSEKR